MISQLEEIDQRMRASGWQKRWFDASDEKVTAVASKANGALIEALLHATGYVDVECCNLFQHGDPVASHVNGMTCLLQLEQVLI